MSSPRAEGTIEFLKRTDGRVASRFVVSQEAAAAVEELLRAKGHESNHHRNSRPVMITAVNSSYQERISTHGAKPIEGYWFPSAKSASLHFGCNPFAVAQGLKRAKEQGKSEATVAGVTLQWAQDVPGVD